MAENPNRFFSTIQVGITLVGILTGALSSVTLSRPMTDTLTNFNVPEGIAQTLSFATVIILVTYLSLVIGELVPKRMGMAFAERIALIVAEPMLYFSRIAYPFIELLTRSTDSIMKMLNITSKKKLPVSEEEVRILIKEGAQMGVFDIAEKNIVEKVLNIGDAKVTALMRARSKIVWLDINSTDEEITQTVLKHQYSYFPVSDGELDNVIGVLRTDSFLAERIQNKGGKLNLKTMLHKTVLIPETKKVLDMLELFKRKRVHQGIIIDEYGTIEGIITLTDILESIVGELPDINEQDDAQIKKRSDNSWFVDGLLSTSDFKEYFQIDELPDENEIVFNTIGGFIMSNLERIPETGDKVQIQGYTLEVTDMDGHRVDKLLVTEK